MREWRSSIHGKRSDLAGSEDGQNVCLSIYVCEPEVRRFNAAPRTSVLKTWPDGIRINMAHICSKGRVLTV